MKVFRSALSVLFLLPFIAVAGPEPAPGFLAIANQGDHTAILIDLRTNQTIFKLTVGVNGHELAASPDRRWLFVPIYGNSGVGKPGTDGTAIDVIDIRKKAVDSHIDLGKPLRPHCAKFGPDGLLYVTAELDKAVYVIDPRSRKIIDQIPTGVEQSHMLVISPDGSRIYTANVAAGSVSVLDVKKRALVTVIPISKMVQRISISPNGKWVFTHDQNDPRIAVIDSATNKLSGWITLPVTVYSSAPTPDGRWLIANSPSGKLFVIDLPARKVASSFDIPGAVGEIAINASGTRAYISCPQDGSIQILNLETNQLDPPIKLTAGVDGLDWLPALP